MSRIFLPIVAILVSYFLRSGFVFAQPGGAAVPNARHYRWKLSFREKELKLDPQKTVYSSRVRIGRQFVAEFKTRNDEWVEFDFVPDDFHRGAFWIEGYVYAEENGKHQFLFRGFNKQHISRIPVQKNLRIRLYSEEL